MGSLAQHYSEHSLMCRALPAVVCALKLTVAIHPGGIQPLTRTSIPAPQSSLHAQRTLFADALALPVAASGTGLDGRNV